MKPKIISRKYYKKRLWKITVSLIPLGKYGQHGFRYVKLYENRKAIGQPWKLINHAIMEF